MGYGTDSKALLAEGLGTFWLVFGGCGSAIFAAAYPELGIGFLGVSLAFGLTVLTGAFALGPVSGGHFNPAVTVGLWLADRFDGEDVWKYVLSQLAGATLGGLVLYIIASGKADFAAGGFASNGYGEHSPGGYGLGAALVAELVLTYIFLIVILGSTSDDGNPEFAPISIGLALTLIHLISIPITNTSVNPARSTGVAFFADGWALQQLWLFWVAPIAGGALAGMTHRLFLQD
jgi:aquaporin Z